MPEVAVRKRGAVTALCSWRTGGRDVPAPHPARIARYWRSMSSP